MKSTLEQKKEQKMFQYIISKFIFGVKYHFIKITTGFWY